MGSEIIMASSAMEAGGVPAAAAARKQAPGSEWDVLSRVVYRRLRLDYSARATGMLGSPTRQRRASGSVGRGWVGDSDLLRLVEVAAGEAVIDLQRQAGCLDQAFEGGGRHRREVAAEVRQGPAHLAGGTRSSAEGSSRDAAADRAGAVADVLHEQKGATQRPGGTDHSFCGLLTCANAAEHTRSQERLITT